MCLLQAICLIMFWMNLAGQRKKSGVETVFIELGNYMRFIASHVCEIKIESPGHGACYSHANLLPEVTILSIIWEETDNYPSISNITLIFIV